MLTELHLEMATWQLLHVLCKDRMMVEVDGGEEEEDLMAVEGGQRPSDKEIMEQLFARDSSVRQAQVRNPFYQVKEVVWG